MSRKENSDEFLPDLFEGSLGGGYDNTSNYSFNITRHVNELMADSSILNDTISIIPSGNGISANRVVLNGNNMKRQSNDNYLYQILKHVWNRSLPRAAKCL